MLRSGRDLVKGKGTVRISSTKKNRDYDEGIERHYTVQQVAFRWNVAVRTIRRLFENEPDVMRICLPRQLGSSQNQRGTLRIPESAVQRVHDYLSMPTGQVEPPEEAEQPREAAPPKAKRKRGRPRKATPALSDAAPVSEEPEFGDARSEDAL